MEGREQIEEFEKLKTVEELVLESKKIEVTENQLKVMANKYLRGDSVELWLRRIARNIALAGVFYLKDLNKEKLLEGVSYKILKSEYSSASDIMLLHNNANSYTERGNNFDKFINNMNKIAKEELSVTQTIKKTEEKFYQMLSNFDFLPNSPTLMNAGRDLQQLSACYVLHVGDSIESIYYAATAAALIHKSGGGTGFSFSKLRPEGDIVKTTKGIASGPISFIKIFDVGTDVIKQGSTRRGANMGIMYYRHPDIKKFITSKSKDKGFLQNFNISVTIDKEFIDAVENDKEIELINPRTKEVTSVERARELWDLMAKCAWETGDPGFVVIDRINNTESNPTPHLGQIESTNPCVTGDTLVSTEFGLMRMKELVSKYPEGGLNILTDSRVPLEIKSLGGNVMYLEQKLTKGVSLDMTSKAFTTGIKEVFRISTTCGLELEATSNHKLLTNGGWVAVKDLNPDQHEIFIQQAEGSFNKDFKLPFNVENNFKGNNGRKYKLDLPYEWSKELGQVLGWLIGDGWLRNNDRNCRVGFTFGKSDDAVLNYLKPIINNFYGKEIKDVKRKRNTKHLSYHSKYFVDFFYKLGVKHLDAGFKTVPESIFTANKDAVIGFLQGLFTSYGTVNFNKKNSISYIRLCSKSKKLLQGVQILLLNLGITSNIFDRSRDFRKGLFKYTNKYGQVVHYDSDGMLFELSMTRDSIKFIEHIGFLCNKNQDKLNKFYTKTFYETEYKTRINSINSIGNKKVYYFT